MEKLSTNNQTIRKSSLPKQRTLRHSICAGGVGIHTGKKVYLTLRPAAPNTGIVFRRVDFDDPVDIPARSENVVDTRLSTTIGLTTPEQGDVRVSTVEHLMSATAGLGVDNMYVDINAPEVPIMDGSSGPFVFLIQSAGIVDQKANKQFVRITKPITVKDGDKWASVKPHRGVRIKAEIEFDHPVVNQHPLDAVFDFSCTAYIKEVSRSRTFGFMKDYEYLRAQNLALGGNLDNAIVLDEYRILNKEGLRYKDEFVKHKILDVIGDMYLLGHLFIGEYEAYKPGHYLNKLLRDEMLKQVEAWEKTDLVDTEEASFSLVPAWAQ